MVTTKAPGLNPNAEVWQEISDQQHQVTESPHCLQMTPTLADDVTEGHYEVPHKVNSTEYPDPPFNSSAPSPVVGILNGMGPPLYDPVMRSTVEGASVEQPLFEDGLRESLKKQLEFCFSRENLSKDLYLISQMDSDQFVPIWTVASMEGIKFLTTDMDLILEVLRASSVVQVDESGVKVRPNHKRCVIILREVPETTPVEEVEDLFKNENCPKVISVEFVANNNWYITFPSDTDAQQAHRYLREEVKTFQGKPIMARIKAVNTFFAKNGYRSSSVYSQQDQSQYTSPGLYMQQAYRPQQQYPLGPPTWSPSQTPYFETPLAPFPNGFLNGYSTPGNFKSGSGPLGLGRLPFHRNRNPVNSFPQPCEEAPSVTPVYMLVDGQSGPASPLDIVPEPDPPALILEDAASEPGGDLGGNGRGRRTGHRGSQRRREDDRALRPIPPGEVKVPQPKFDLATSSFPPLPGSVGSVRGEHLSETRMSDVVRGLKVVPGDQPVVSKECVTGPTRTPRESVSMPSFVTSVLVEPLVPSVSLPVKKVEKPELNVQMKSAPTLQIQPVLLPTPSQPPAAVTPAPTPTSTLATPAPTPTSTLATPAPPSSSTEPRKLSYAEMCKRPATQHPAPSKPSTSATQHPAPSKPSTSATQHPAPSKPSNPSTSATQHPAPSNPSTSASQHPAPSKPSNPSTSASQHPAPSNPSNPSTSASQPLRELRVNKPDEPASSSSNIDRPEKSEGSGEGRPHRDPLGSFRGGNGAPRPGGMGLKAQRQQRGGATAGRRTSPPGRVRLSGKEQNIPPPIAKVVHTD